MNKLRVLYVSPVSFFKGGAERSLFDLMKNPLIESALIVPEPGDISREAERLGIPVYPVDFGLVHTIHRPFRFFDGLRAISDAVKAALKIKRIARDNKIDILHSNGLKAHILIILANFMGGPASVTHFRDIAYTRQERWVWSLIVKCAKRAVFVSKACWPYDELPSNGKVIFNGITPPTEIISRGETNSELKLGFIGRIHPNKGLHNLLRWIASAKKAGYDIRLIVRGTYSSDAPEYENLINSIVEEEGLGEVVRFEGFVEGIQRIYAEIDAVCAVAEAPEPLARTILEPLALGIPVIATPTGGTTEMVLDGETGFLVTDSTSFISAVQTIRDDGPKIDQMIAAGRKHVAENFSLAKLHKEIETLYRQLA